MASVVSEHVGPSSTISSALEELEFKYTTPPENIEPFIKFLSSSPPKGQCLQKLRQIVLSRNGISELGDLQFVAETLKNASTIDLSYNELRDWTIIGDLLQAIPSLKQIDLSFNPLDGPIDDCAIPACSNLETLGLNGVDLSLKILAHLLYSLPQLKVLQICRTSLELPNEGNVNDEQFLFDQLTDLYMDACDLNSWSDCMHYAKMFPSLRKLYLSENNFSEIFERCDQTNLHIKDAMPQLNMLYLYSSAINNWKSIEALGVLPVLEHLRIREAPLFDEYDCETRHMLIVPRIPSLQTLNGSTINKRYREDCERFFIRYYQNRDDKPTKIYDHLIDVHGNLEQLVCIDLSPQKYVKARLRCDEQNINLIMRLRLNITIRAFIGAVVRATGIPLNKIRVLHTTPQYPARGPTELRPSSTFMHTLRIEDNDEFQVFSKAVPSHVSHL